MNPLSPRSRQHVNAQPRREAFTLIELLVVISIIALLIGILLPALAAARRSARVVADLSNHRQMGIAHAAWSTEHGNLLIGWADLITAAAMPGTSSDAFGSWPLPTVPVSAEHDHEGGERIWSERLLVYGGPQMMLRSPLDESEHWEEPVTVEQEDELGNPIDVDVLRLTSYGLNDFLTEASEGPRAYRTWDSVPSASSTISFLMMAEEGGFAVADHPHASEWTYEPIEDALPEAAEQIAIDAAGGPPATLQSRSNYGFLDGHAETRTFGQVYDGNGINLLDPQPGL